VLLVLALAAGCAHSTAPEPTEADAARSGIELAELVSGRRLYVGHCGGCHLPPEPSAHSTASWPGHVGEMRERAGLTVEEGRLVERYVVTMASRP
jgi:hypothetical protein